MTSFGTDFVDAAATAIALARRRRRVPLPSPALVNLGSSLRVARGWLNVDGSPIALVAGLPRAALAVSYRVAGVRATVGPEEYVRILSSNRFLHHRLEYPLPFADGSVDHIYAGEVIERLPADVALRVLREARRVLKRGGAIRIGVPDLELAVQRYLVGDKQAALGFFLYDNRRGGLSAHRSMWDEALLEEALLEAGFSSVVRCRSREGKTPDLGLLDVWPGDAMLCVEAE